MNNGDKIIWDSGFGYEIGHFISVGKIGYNAKNNFKVNLVTGIATGKVEHSNNEIIVFNEENNNKMFEKYNYIHQFDIMNKNEEILQTLNNVLFEPYVNQDISEEDVLKDLGLDSLDKIELCIGVENHYDINISDDEIELLVNVGNLVELISNKT